MVRPVILSISSVLAVSMMTGKWWSLRISLHRVKPEMSGSITSRMARSSAWVRTHSSASAPFRQENTVNPSLLR